MQSWLIEIEPAGPDGLIEFTRDEVVYASRAGKRVYIGVETAPAGASRKVFLWGFSRAEWSAITPRTFPLLFTNRLNGFRLTTLAGKTREYIGLAEPDGAFNAEEFEAALQRLDRMLNRPGVDPGELRAEAEATVAANREYEGYGPYLGRNGNPAGFRTTAKATPKITFSGLTKADLEKELAAVAAAFAADAGFHGFAIHHYGTYKALKP